MIGLFFILFYYPRKKKEEKILSRNFTEELKGISIIIIIIHHLCRHTISNSRDLNLFYDLGYIGVVLFLLLSGYGLTESAKNKGANNFFIKKLIRVYIPFVAMNFLWVILNKYLLGYNLSILEAVKSILGFIIFDRNYWYIKYLIFWYIAFYFTFKHLKSKKSKVIIILLISIISMISPTMQNGRLNSLSFPIGVIIGLYKDNIEYYYNKIKSSEQKLIIPGVLLLMSYYLYEIIIKSQSNYFIQKIVILLGIVIIIGYKFKINIAERIALMLSVFLVLNYIDFNENLINIIQSLSGAIAAVGIIMLTDALKRNSTSKFF